MKLLVSGGTVEVRRLLGHPCLGVLITPTAGNNPPDSGVTWAADNAAFSGFDDCRFRRMLKKIKGRDDCRFVAAPDVVGDHLQTRKQWSEWAPMIRGYGLRPAFVCQDGCLEGDVPWDDLLKERGGAVFIGGTTRYKLSEMPCLIVRRAWQWGLWSHVGRVNSAKRLLWCMALGVDSVDGSSFSRFSSTHIPWALRVLRQGQLFSPEGDHA